MHLGDPDNYSPCPPDIEDPLLHNQFIHELLKPGPHLDNYWIATFPKKLKCRLEYATGTRPIGWGIIIHEGINLVLILFGVFAILIATGLVVIVYGALTKDVSAAAGIGAYLVAILSIMVTLQYSKWQQA